MASKRLVPLIAVAYGILSVLLAWWNAQDNKTTERRSPSQSTCLSDGPFKDKRQLVLFGQLPTNDYTVARRSMMAQSLGKILDPTFDVNCALAFIVSGQPYYGFGMFCAMFIPNTSDPLQTKGTEMFFSSLTRAFPVRGMYVVNKREGSYEGVLSLLVALHALMRRAYVSNNMTGYEFVAIALSALSSLLSALPAAAMARDLLFAEAKGELDFNDFYSVEQKKQSFGTRRFLPSVDCLSFGIAIAVTFQSNRMLVQLWYIGFVVGILWWIVYWQMYELRALPTVRGALGFVLTFTCWFLAPTRLGAYPEVQDALFSGTCPLHQAALRGCASLRPGAYYFHRIVTLTTFWIAAGYTHEGFFSIVYKALVAGKGEVIVSVLLVLGWLSLVAEAVIFYINKDSFHMGAKKMEEDNNRRGFAYSNTNVYSNAVAPSG